MEISLDEKVKRWVEKEGYPLEFSTAHKFKKRRFSVEQSYFAKDENGKAREVDVLATANVPIGRSFLRIKHVVECKWSKDKPWVLFKDEKRFATSALAAQLISSSAGPPLAMRNLKSWACLRGRDFLFQGDKPFQKVMTFFTKLFRGLYPTA